MEFKAFVQNVPKQCCRYIVVRCVANELWYWGSWESKEAAERVASEFDNGLVLEQIAL